MAKITNNYPQFVMMGDSTALRLVHEGKGNYFYYRDGGDWSTDIKFDDNGLMKSSSHVGSVNNHRLTATTEKEWRKSNGQYAPSKFERYGWECESTNPCLEIELLTETVDKYKYLLIR